MVDLHEPMHSGERVEPVERVKLRRWTGDGLPPGPWASDPSIFVVTNDTARVETQEFLPTQALSALVETLDERARKARNESANHIEMSRVHRCDGQAHAWTDAAELVRQLLDPPE